MTTSAKKPISKNGCSKGVKSMPKTKLFRKKTANEEILAEGNAEGKKVMSKVLKFSLIGISILFLILHLVELRMMKTEIVATQVAVRQICDFQVKIRNIPTQMAKQNQELLKSIGRSTEASEKIAHLESRTKDNSQKIAMYEKSYNALREKLAELESKTADDSDKKPSKLFPWNWGK